MNQKTLLVVSFASVSLWGCGSKTPDRPGLTLRTTTTREVEAQGTTNAPLGPLDVSHVVLKLRYPCTPAEGMGSHPQLHLFPIEKIWTPAFPSQPSQGDESEHPLKDQLAQCVSATLRA